MAQPAQQQLAEFEQLVLANLSHQNETRAQAEHVLTQLRNTQPGAFVQALMALLLAGDRGQPQAREFCAVILRQNLLINSSSQVWQQCGPAVQAQLQAGLLHLFTSERTPGLRSKITDCVAATASRIAGTNVTALAVHARGLTNPDGTSKVPEVLPEEQQAKWEELMPTVMNLAQQDVPDMRQSILDLVDKLAEYNPAVLRPYGAQLKHVMMCGFRDPQMKIRLAALRACCSVLQSLEEEERLSLQDCVPPMFEVLGSAFKDTDDETMRAAVGHLASVSPKFLKAHLKPIVDAMVQVVQCTSLEADTRRCAMEFLLTLVEEGKGMVRKTTAFAQQVVPLAFGLVQELEHTAEWDTPQASDKEGDDDDGQDNYKFGCECIARLAGGLGGKLFMQVISPLILSSLKSPQWNVRHAALITVSRMAIGVDKHMEDQLASIMQTVVMPLALNDPHHRVRWAAVDTCAFLADAFEPDFANSFPKEVFTILMACTAPNQHWRVIAHACLCFPDFCRGLEKEHLLPFMPTFLTSMVACLGMMSTSPMIVENALAAVSAVAMVAQKDFAPYYAHFMPGVKGIIMSATDGSQKKVRGKAIECMGMMAQAVGAETFGPELQPVMEALLRMLIDEKLPSDDPQHEHVVTTCARICKAVGPAFAPYLPRVIPPLLVSARIEDACVIVAEGESNPFKGREGYTTSEVHMRQAGKQQISMNTSLLEEKARAIRMLFEYANTMGAAFFPYVAEVANILVPCVRYQFEGNVREHAVRSLAPLLRCSNEALASDPARRAEHAQQLLKLMWPVVMQGIIVEYDIEALCDMLGEWSDVIEALPPGVVLGQEEIDEVNLLVRRLVIDLLERCRKRDEQAQSEDCDEAEQELIDAENQAENELLGYVYQLVNRLVKNNPALYPDSFHTHLHPLMAAMMQSDDASLRTTAICMIAQVMEDCPTHPHSQSYAQAMHECCVASLTNPDEPQKVNLDDVELAQSAAFGLGVCSMVLRGGYASQAPSVLRLLAAMLEQARAAAAKIAAARARAERAGKAYDDSDDGADSGLATDNALGAMVKIFAFTYNNGAPVNGVPVCPAAEVAPLMAGWVTFLPAHSDLVEAKKIHSLFAELIAANNAFVLGEGLRNLPSVLRVFGAILAYDTPEDITEPATRGKLLELWQGMQKQMPQEQLKQVLQALTPEAREQLKKFAINPAAFA